MIVRSSESSELPELTEEQLRQWIPEPSLARGRRYHRTGRIVNPRSQGDCLKASCRGSQTNVYHVEILLGSRGIISADCSCPVGLGGHCKHAAALLLTWMDDTGAIAKVDSLDTVLQQRSKDELIELIQRLVRRYPEIEEYLELPLLGAGPSTEPVDPEIIQRQVNRAFSGREHDWQARYEIVRDLESVVDIGNAYAEQSDWASAAIVYQSLAHGTLENYGLMLDEDGMLYQVVHQCTLGLSRCLQAISDPGHREKLLSGLFYVFRWDVDRGGYGIGDHIPDIIVAGARAEKREKVAQWIRQSLPQGLELGDCFQRQMYGWFLLQVEEMDDEAFIRTCRLTDRLYDLVDRLLALKRLDEAVHDAGRASDHVLLSLADLFISHGYADAGEQLVRERTISSDDPRLRTWLKERARQRGDLAEALALAEWLFWQRPSVSLYGETRDLALGVGLWEPMRTDILTRMAAEDRHSVLTQLHLLEGNIGQALATLKIVSQRSRWGIHSLNLEVAEAAEDSHPDDAIRLYLDEAEHLIGARGRGSYAEAARHLLCARAVYHKAGRIVEWNDLIADIREKYGRLPAMQDEFNQAGL